MSIDDITNDIPDTAGVREEEVKIEESPLFGLYEGLHENEHVQAIVKHHDDKDYDILCSVVYDDMPQFTIGDVKKFWGFVEARKSEYDDDFAGFFAGIIISYLREHGVYEVINLPVVSLSHFCQYGKYVHGIDIDRVSGKGCFAGAARKGIVSHIKIGVASGDWCFANAAHYGSISDVRIDIVSGDWCFEDAGMDAGRIINVKIGAVTGNRLFYGAENLRNITIGKRKLAKPTYQEIQEVAYGNK